MHEEPWRWKELYSADWWKLTLFTVTMHTGHSFSIILNDVYLSHCYAGELEPIKPGQNVIWFDYLSSWFNKVTNSKDEYVYIQLQKSVPTLWFQVKVTLNLWNPPDILLPQPALTNPAADANINNKNVSSVQLDELGHEIYEEHVNLVCPFNWARKKCTQIFKLPWNKCFRWSCDFHQLQLVCITVYNFKSWKK